MPNLSSSLTLLSHHEFGRGELRLCDALHAFPYHLIGGVDQACPDSTRQMDCSMMYGLAAQGMAVCCSSYRAVLSVQTYLAPGRLEPRVKASQCFTKYKWRDLDAAKRQSGPQIVATQVLTRAWSFLLALPKVHRGQG